MNLPDLADFIVLAHGGEAPADNGTLMLLMPALPFILIATIVVATLLDRRGLLRRQEDEVRLTTSLGAIAAALSLGAGALHLAVIQSHLQEDVLEGLSFIGIALFQVLWPLAFVLTRRRAIAAVGALVNAAIVSVWIISRTIGLPFGAEPGVVQSIGSLDLFATGFEIALVAALIPTIAPRLAQTFALRRLPYQRAFVLAAFGVVTVALLTSVALLPPANESALEALVH